MKIQGPISGFLLAGLLAGTLPGLASLAEVRERGELIVLSWPHQESNFVRRMVKEYGEEGLHRFTGIDVDVLRGYADSLGVELRIQPVREGFGELIPALLAGEGDVIGSSMTITRNRRAQIDFSIPYHAVKKVVVTREGSDLDTVEDLAGHTAAAGAGSSHEEHLQALQLEGLEILNTLFMLENYQAVAEGEADFTLVDSGSADRVLGSYAGLAKKLEVAFAFPMDDEYGFGLPPGSDLKPSLDAYLRQLEQSGELARIKAKYGRD